MRVLAASTISGSIRAYFRPGLRAFVFCGTGFSIRPLCLRAPPWVPTVVMLSSTNISNTSTRSLQQTLVKLCVIQQCYSTGKPIARYNRKAGGTTVACVSLLIDEWHSSTAQEKTMENFWTSPSSLGLGTKCCKDSHHCSTKSLIWLCESQLGQEARVSSSGALRHRTHCLTWVLHEIVNTSWDLYTSLEMLHGLQDMQILRHQDPVPQCERHPPHQQYCYRLLLQILFWVKKAWSIISGLTTEHALSWMVSIRTLSASWHAKARLQSCQKR